MQFVNATSMNAGFTTGLRRDGRELLIVAIKGSFRIPDDPRHEPALADVQAPLVVTDEFAGEPGQSAPVYEIDYAATKPRCDVLLNGSAHAPGGRPAERVTVTLKVGSMTKSFDVVGDRTWKAGTFATAPTRPTPFTVMPISYENAFGGVDRSQKDPIKHVWFLPNHVGIGFHARADAEVVDGTPLPNTEECGKPITQPAGKYRPMAFGPVARAWQPRVQLAGTYDQKWLDERFPFLPEDFDERYYQAAPDDQQVDHPTGGEEVELVNLTPAGKTAFRLPRRNVPVSLLDRNGGTRVVRAAIDTVVIEPDLGRLLLTWRATFPLRRNAHEVRQVLAGRSHRDRPGTAGLPKRRFRSLAELVEWRRRNGTLVVPATKK